MSTPTDATCGLVLNRRDVFDRRAAAPRDPELARLTALVGDALARMTALPGERPAQSSDGVVDLAGFRDARKEGSQ